MILFMKTRGALLSLLPCLTALLLLLPACGGKQEAGRESLLREKDREFVREKTAGMTQEVRLILFTADQDCEYCELAEEFLQDVASLSPLLTTEILSLERDAGRAGDLAVDKAPGIAIIGKADYGIRYYGLPTGYEFVTFVETIRKVADGSTGLLDETVEALGGLKHPVTITVFSTKS